MSKSCLHQVIQNSLSVKFRNHLPYGQNSCDMYSTVAHILVFCRIGANYAVAGIGFIHQTLLNDACIDLIEAKQFHLSTIVAL